MKDLSGALVAELRRKASEGASVPDMLRLLHQQIGPGSAYSTTLAKYFMAAFELPLRTVSPIGGWASDSTGEISDVRIQELIFPEIMQKQQFWVRTAENDPVATAEPRDNAIKEPMNPAGRADEDKATGLEGNKVTE